MYKSCEGRVVLLAGASSDIGEVTAMRYAEDGAHLVPGAR